MFRQESQTKLRKTFATQSRGVVFSMNCAAQWMCKIDNYNVNTPSEFARAAAPDDQVAAREDEDDLYFWHRVHRQRIADIEWAESYSYVLNGISAEMWHALCKSLCVLEVYVKVSICLPPSLSPPPRSGAMLGGKRSEDCFPSKTCRCRCPWLLEQLVSARGSYGVSGRARTFI